MRLEPELELERALVHYPCPQYEVPVSRFLSRDRRVFFSEGICTVKVLIHGSCPSQTSVPPSHERSFDQRILDDLAGRRLQVASIPE